MDFGKFWGGGGAAPYEIEQSLRFAHEDNAYLSRSTGSVTPSNAKIFTTSVWVKYNPNTEAGGNGDRKIFGSSASNTYNFQVQFSGNDASGNGGNKIGVNAYPGSPSTFYTNLDPAYGTNVRRDPAAWLHIVFRCDTTQATDTNRIKMWINGESYAPWSGTVRYPAQNSEYPWNDGSNRTLYIGYTNLFNGIANYFDGYMAEFHNVDGQALSHTDFGEFDDNGVWRPIEYTGTHGNLGFYLKFDPSATNGIGHDHSANSNNFTANNMTTSGTGTDVLNDTPTNNFPTFNPLALNRGLNEGNLKVGTGHGNGDFVWTKTIAANQGGNYYWEYNVTNVQASSDFYFGVLEYTDPIHRWPDWPYGVRNKVLMFNTNTSNTEWLVRGSYVNSNAPSGGFTVSAGDVVGVRLDIDNDLITLSKNGTVQTGLSGYLSSDTSVYYTPATDVYGTNDSVEFNAGQRALSHQPSGTTTLCTANLATPDVANPSDHFNTVVYSGNDSTQSINTVGFQPDLVWVKNRNNTSAHMLFDSVRGVSATSAPGVSSNQSVAEVDYNGNVNNRMLTSLDPSGFSVGADQYGWHVNKSGRTYVAWCWKAGNGTSTPTQGTIASTASVNQEAGFSIVTYTGNGTSGATIGHGLGVAPSFIAVKARDSITGGGDWNNYHAALGATKRIFFNLDSAAQTTANGWNNTAPTSTVFTVGSGTDVNQNTKKYVAYCFAEKQGYSRFGSYTGNGSNDGPFVYCGFRPAFVCLKGIGFTSNWNLYDSTRSTSNLTDDLLRPNLSNAEIVNYSPYGIDILSNGFKLRTSSGDWNSNTQEFLFMAFAEHPFGGDGVSPTTAR